MRHPSRYADVPLSQRRHRLTRTPRRMGLGRLSLSLNVSHSYLYHYLKVAWQNYLPFNSRSTEVTSFRLRLGKFRLNANLHQIGCHETGLCSHCQEFETIQHYIMDCQFSTVARALRTTCILRGEKSNVSSILQNNSLIETIHKLSDRRL